MRDTERETEKPCDFLFLCLFLFNALVQAGFFSFSFFFFVLFAAVAGPCSGPAASLRTRWRTLPRRGARTPLFFFFLFCVVVGELATRHASHSNGGSRFELELDRRNAARGNAGRREDGGRLEAGGCPPPLGAASAAAAIKPRPPRVGRHQGPRGRRCLFPHPGGQRRNYQVPAGACRGKDSTLFAHLTQKESWANCVSDRTGPVPC